MKFTWWKTGSWNTICDRCGFKFKAEELQEEWDKLRVCKDCWEIRHPQELIHPIPDQNKLPWTRPEATDTFINSCTVNGRTGITGYMVGDCAICEREGPIDIEDIEANRVAGDV